MYSLLEANSNRYHSKFEDFITYFIILQGESAMSNSIRFVILIFFSISLHLTVFAQEEALKLKKLSKEADVIVTGKVTQKESSWNDSKTRIYTRTTVEVEEYLKGSNQTSLVEILSMGGEVGEVGEIYSHMPRFEDKEEVLVFLRKDSKSEHYKVSNGEAGKISIFSDDKSEKKKTGLNVSLNELKRQIRGYLEEK
jgi:hypothetical protein